MHTPTSLLPGDRRIICLFTTKKSQYHNSNTLAPFPSPPHPLPVVGLEFSETPGSKEIPPVEGGAVGGGGAADSSSVKEEPRVLAATMAAWMAMAGVTWIRPGRGMGREGLWGFFRHADKAGWQGESACSEWWFCVMRQA